MKKTQKRWVPILVATVVLLTGLALAAVISSAADGDVIHFPDPYFEECVRSAIGKPLGNITKADVAGITELSVYNSQIRDLSGIEYLTALTSFSIGNAQLTKFDLSQNTALTSLYCGNNRLTSLDIRQNTELTYLHCSGNRLTELDLSQNTALTHLYCEYNQLTELDLSQNTALKELHCSYNIMPSIDVIIGLGELNIEAYSFLPQYIACVTFVDYDGTFWDRRCILQGENVYAPSPPRREGYEFTGWDKDFSNATGNLTVTATYKLITEITYTVTFADYDGTVLKTQTDLAYGKAATAPANPEREGYVFVNWDKYFGSVTGNLTVTAIYKKVYTVTFVDYDGTVLGTETVVEGGKAWFYPPPREGYHFTGWDTELYNITSDLTVTATYVKCYVVTFVDHDGTVLKTQYVAPGDYAWCASPEREGYRFMGWDLDIGLYITSDLTITATYKRIYNVSFLAHDGTVLKTQTISEGEEATAPIVPYREGYYFAGWAKNLNETAGTVTYTAMYVAAPGTTDPGTTPPAGPNFFQMIINFFVQLFQTLFGLFR